MGLYKYGAGTESVYLTVSFCKSKLTNGKITQIDDPSAVIRTEKIDGSLRGPILTTTQL